MPILGTHGSTMSSAKSAAVCLDEQHELRASHQLIKMPYRAADGYTRPMRTHGYYRRFVGLCAPRKFPRASTEKMGRGGGAEATGFARTRLIHGWSTSESRESASKTRQASVSLFPRDSIEMFLPFLNSVLENAIPVCNQLRFDLEDGK